MSDDVIDLATYLEGRGERTTFAVRGGEGERSRLALPVWRAVYLLDGDRGGIVWTPRDGRDTHAFFVLDLRDDPARVDFDPAVTDAVRERDPPAVETLEGAVCVLLARDEHRSWHLVVMGPGAGRQEPGGRIREDLFFVAGECAGLLMHRELASEV